MTRITDRKSATGWQKKYDLRASKVGATAPDFNLRDANKQNPVSLAGFRQKKAPSPHLWELHLATLRQRNSKPLQFTCQSPLQ